MFFLIYGNLVGVEDSEDRKKLYFLIQRLQTVILFTITKYIGKVTRNLTIICYYV